MTLSKSRSALLFACIASMTILAGAGTALAERSADPAKALVGLWSAERNFGPEVSGRLVVREEAGRLTARIAGIEAPVKKSGNGVRFELPGNRGSFRGRFQGEARQLVGHWVQPSTAMLNYPSASPVRFERRENEWVGEVTPLVDRLRLYLSIRRLDDGTLRAFMRNPERNLGIYQRLHSVELDGPRLRFLREDGELALEGRYHAADGIEAIALYFPSSGVSFDFRRADRNDATAFYPSAQNDTYSYRTPRASGDGWETAPAAESGMRPAPLQDLVRHVRDTVTDSVRTPYIHSILVARKGKLVLEEYFYGYHADEVHDTRSAGKSVASMIIGAALDDDDKLKARKTLQSVFGERAREPRATGATTSHDERSKWRRLVNLGHLLSMSSGLACDDDEFDSPGNEDRMQDQGEQPDWVQFALDVPMKRPPGTKAVYCSNSINLAAAAVAHEKKAWLPEFFGERIAAPLDIDRYYFNLDPSGQGYMGGGIRLTPRDQLKLGQVMLDGGIWRGKRVLSQEWVAESLASHAGIHEPDDYGYGWWRKELPFDGGTVEVFYAGGNGGQLVIGVPELNLVVQFSGGNYSDFPVWSRFLTELVPKYVLPAVMR